MPTGVQVLAALAALAVSATGLRVAETRAAWEASVDARLAQLREALQARNGPAVLQITEELREPFLASQPPVDHALPATTAARQKRSGSAVAKAGVQGTCIFDDQLFSLTPEAKLELTNQLQDPKMQEALHWVRTGGWWVCAAAPQKGFAAENCACSGQVRLKHVSGTQQGHVVQGTAHNGVVACSASVFGASLASTEDMFCECAAGVTTEIGGVDTFHLERRLSSASVLQESWVMLLRFLGRSHLLPLGTGDRLYSGMQNWAARSGQTWTPSATNVVLERYWLNKYIREVAGPQVVGPRCMEWGQPKTPGKGFDYANMVPSCTEKYDMQYDFIYWQNYGMALKGNVIYSDIINLPRVLGAVKMNTIFATQVFEHLADPMQSAQALFEATAPGGVVIYTGPQQAQFHKVPHDYYRYTVEGVKYLFVRAGFCVPNWAFAGGGDFVFDIGRDAGLQVQDFPVDELDAAFQVGYDNVSHGAIGIHCLAFKPPHATCNDPTAGWAELARQGIQA